jgi:hypothetical protein
MKQRPINFIGFLFCFLAIVCACKKTKMCGASSLDQFPAFPYSPGQKIIFRDTLQNEITVTMNSQYEMSSAYELTLTSSLNVSTGDKYCGAQIVLNSVNGTSTDSLFNPKSANLRIDFEKFTEGPDKDYTSFSVGGVFNMFIIGTIANNGVYTFENNSTIPVSTYTTPFKTYKNIFANKPSTSPSHSWRRLFFDGKGKIISFNIQKDTLRTYYLVE